MAEPNPQRPGPKKRLIAAIVPFLIAVEGMPVASRLILMVICSALGTGALFVAASDELAALLFLAMLATAMLVGRTIQASCARVHDYVLRFGVDGCDYRATGKAPPCGKLPVVLKRCEEHHGYWLP